MNDDDKPGTKIVPITEKRWPPRAGMGRPAGSLNKTTATLKQALEESFTRLGGVEWLMTLAASEPSTYARLLVKLLPTKIDAEINVNELTEEQRLQRFNALLDAARARRADSNSGGNP